MSYHCVSGDSSMRRVHVQSCQVNGMIQAGAWRKDPNEAQPKRDRGMRGISLWVFSRG